MNQVIDFFSKLLNVSDWPPRWHCGQWSDFHGWLYIISDLLIWSAYFSIPLVILRYVARRRNVRFLRLYYLFAAFILACGATHFLDAIAFWLPYYRLSALVRFITGIISWVTVFYLVKHLPFLFSMRPLQDLELEIEQRKKAELALVILNEELEKKVKWRTLELEKSEERFRFIIEQYPAPVVRFTPNGDFVSANLQWEIMWEDKVENAKGYNILLDPHIASLPIKKNVEEAFSGTASRSGTFLLDPAAIGKPGRKRWMELLLFPVKDKEWKIMEVIAVHIDMTDKKESELKLLEQEMHFKAMIENSSEGIMLTDKDFNIIYRSPASQKIMGNLPRDLSLHANVHPEDQALLIEKRARALQQPGAPIPFEIRRIHEDGHPIWVEGTFTNMLEVSGVQAIVTNYRDITQKKLTEQLVHDNEIRFRTLIDNISDAIVINHPDTKIIYQSPSVTRILGYTAEERKDKEVYDYIHPDDQPSFKAIYRQLKNEPGVPIAFQYRVLHKNGHYVWVEGVVNNLLNDPLVKAYVANYRDITERKQAEEALFRSEKMYKTIASSIPGSFICIFDNQFRYLQIEGDMIEKLGYNRSQMLGRTIDEVIDNDRLNWVKEALQKALNGEMVAFQSEMKGYFFMNRFIPLKSETNVIYAIMTVTIDITALRMAQRNVEILNRDLEEKVAQRTKELRISNQELESFSYSVSHDLRAPLRSIIGFTAILEEEYASQLDPEAKRVAAVIKQSAEKMGNLIDDLLAFSRTGRRALQLVSLSMEDMVQEAQKILAQEYPLHHWNISRLPMVSADSNLLRQVWTNLLTNACKYSSKSPEPSINISCEEKPNRHVFRIHDNGVGFNSQ